MQVKTYLGTLALKCDGVHSSARYLVVANSLEQAREILDAQAAMYWSEPEDSEAKDDGWYFYKDMDAWAHANALHEIGLATYWDLKDALPVRSGVPLDKIPTLEEASQECSKAAQALRAALASKGVEVKQSVLLHAIAASVGETNWQALRSKVARAAAERQALKELCWDVVNSCDNAGCDESLTVADADSVAKLWQYLTANP